MLDTTSSFEQTYEYRGALLLASSWVRTLPVPEYGCVLEPLLASSGEGVRQTFTYCWKGEGTLSWDEPGKWLQVKWLRCLVDSSLPVQRSFGCLKQYNDFVAIQSAIQCPQCHELDDLYVVQDAREVYRFLNEHVELAAFLLEAYPHVVEHFGPSPRVELRVIRDPEGHGSEQLFAYIHTSLPVQEALSRLELLDEEWFLDQIDRVGDVFNFNVEIA